MKIARLTNDKKVLLVEELIEYPSELNGGRNLAYPIYDNYRSYGGSLTSTVVQEVSGNLYRTYLVKVEEGQSYIATQKGVGQSIRHFWFKNNPIENLNSEVAIGGGYHAHLTLNVPLIPPAGANWIFVVATTNNDTHPVSEIKIEKGTIATDWTPAPEDLGLDYPDDIQYFSTGFRSNGKVLVRELIEGEDFSFSSDKKMHLNELEEGVDL